MQPHERLSAAMNERRLDLRLNWKQLAASAGISAESLGAIRRGEYRPSQLTARGIEDTLKWERGSVQAILAGGEPETVAERWTEAEPQPEPRVGHDFAERIERILNNPAALKRAEDLLRAARIPEIEEEEDRRGRDTG